VIRPNQSLFLQTFGSDPLVTLEVHRNYAEFRGNLDDEIERPIRRSCLLFNFDKFEKTGAVERSNVPIESRLIERSTLSNLHVRANDRFVHVRRSHESDRDGPNFECRSLLNCRRLSRLLGQNRRSDSHHQTQQRKDGKGDPAHRVTGESFQSE
jgi:hypothetical protein